MKTRPWYLLGCAVLLGGVLAGCGGNSHSRGGTGLPDLPSEAIGDGGAHQAEIRRTSGGVPHIRAATLESAAFGMGYIQAEDNLCLIADQILRARGERALFYGPGNNSDNIISDFSVKALDTLSAAERAYETLSEPSQAMLRGFVAGYNRYLEQSDPAAGDPAAGGPRCAGEPWVRPISATDLLAYYRLVSMLASGTVFATGATFMATPPGGDPNPVLASSDDARHAARLAWHKAPPPQPATIDFTDLGIASNGWGLGREMTASGRGALLANPHFPYSGARRFYQSQITVPGVVNIMGAGLAGFVLPQVAFNQHLAWTNTVTTSQQFTLYRLSLKPGDNQTYLKDGQEKPITSRNITIEVANGSGASYTLQKPFYYSEYGPMLAADLVAPGALGAWGDNGEAYTYRDANQDTFADYIDTALNMARSTNLAQFQSVFENCGRALWVNVIYADDQGNAFYLDGSSVPNLSDASIAALQQRLDKDPLAAALFAQKLTILDGAGSRDDWVDGQCQGLVPYERTPKLVRGDFVQNSNDSFWASNPQAPLTGYSPLFGDQQQPLSARTRLGLSMLTEPTNPGLSAVKPAGEDGKFSAQELLDMLYSNRAYLAETLLDELLDRCAAVGASPVGSGSDARPVDKGCDALAGWDGLYNLDSRGAHTFRVFAGHYQTSLPGDYSVAFDPADPIHTPSTPAPASADLSTDPMLTALAQGLNDLDQANLAYDARLADVQYVQLSEGVPPGGSAVTSGARIPWHGGSGNLEGAFNAMSVSIDQVAPDTQFPQIAPAKTVANTGGLSAVPGEGWMIGYGTSWHFGVEFTDEGPRAFGLLSYSESTNSQSAHFRDQQERFSDKDYRRILFTDAAIDADPELSIRTVQASD